MNAKFVLIVPISALLLSASGLSMAAAGEGATAYQKAQPDMHGKGASGMGGMGGMMGQGAKGGDMMGACPMMGGASHLDPKTSMQMQGEMMKAMGDIMLKYADRLDTSPSK
ncbi:hypothetical protein OI25_7725 [Paraburkholderia fungorum]|jgi:hypothetical protein|uniref:Uncharacterized protein n=1 Tax=Paraburkholderia fungorum TaxID=134537 RepID=A0AAP5UYW1_9BURK|nr:hypothetical protein [Paraburkholderia fungorum]AJZ56604.1 hypothetical protein OI25_7725 [Paraburkholderia fungorum]MDT8843476.1 hypothetical protein [Paraburkholderia fungorum]PRZ45520.1 hypothetical protein BX589_13835 [Paraburkholderia fungorum]